MKGVPVNLTDYLDLLGALLLIAGAGTFVSVLLGVWAGLILAGLLVLVLSWLVGRLNVRGDSK